MEGWRDGWIDAHWSNVQNKNIKHKVKTSEVKDKTSQFKARITQLL